MNNKMLEKAFPDKYNQILGVLDGKFNTSDIPDEKLRGQYEECHRGLLVEAKLSIINDILAFSGVISKRYYKTPYCYSIIALYCNNGSITKPTILYDVETNDFMVISYNSFMTCYNNSL